MNNFDWTQLINPEFYITLQIGGIQIGLYIVLFIVFAETGLFAGFFLPGDSLLFLSGIYASGSVVDGVYHPGLVDQFVHIDSEFINVLMLWNKIISDTHYFESRVIRENSRHPILGPLVSIDGIKK